MRRWRGLRPGKSNYVVSQSLKHTKLAQDNGGLGVQDSQLFAKAATRNSGHTSRSKVFASKQRLFVAPSVAVVFVDSTTLYQGQVCAHIELTTSLSPPQCCVNRAPVIEYLDPRARDSVCGRPFHTNNCSPPNIGSYGVNI